MIDVTGSYNINHLSIWHNFKYKDKITEHMKSALPTKSAIISKKHGKVIEEMEKRLSARMQDLYQQ